MHGSVRGVETMAARIRYCGTGGKPAGNGENKLNPKLLENPIYSTCVQARSQIPAGVNPAPARPTSHREENSGPAGVIPKVKHRGIEPTGRKRKLK